MAWSAGSALLQKAAPSKILGCLLPTAVGFSRYTGHFRSCQSEIWVDLTRETRIGGLNIYFMSHYAYKSGNYFASVVSIP